MEKKQLGPCARSLYLSHIYAQMHQINAHSEATGLSLHLNPYFVYASSEALVSLCMCENLLKPPLFIDTIRTEISGTGVIIKCGKIVGA